jgi:signal peptidase
VVVLVLRASAVGYLTAMTSLTMWASVPAAWGWQSALVVGHSMNPAIAAGDVLVTSPFTAAQLRAGTTVLFERPGFSDGSLIAHRIESSRGDGTFVTRGDANGQADSSPVRTEQIRGVARLRVPAVGRPMLWLRQGQWALFTGFAMVTIIAVTVALTRRAGGEPRRSPTRPRSATGGGVEPNCGSSAAWPQPGTPRLRRRCRERPRPERVTS